MNWTRYKLLIISGAITVIVCGGLLFWIISGASAAGQLENDIRSLTTRQNQLTSENPYPSEANLNALNAEQEKVEERRDAIRVAIADGQVETRRVSRSVFGDYIQDVVPALREAAASATKGGENGVIVRDPDFGLTEFLEGSLPNQDRIDQLVIEIETMKHLAGLLFEGGISELITLGVAEEETSSRPTSGVPGIPGGRGVPGGIPGPGARAGAMQGGETDPRSELQKEKERMFQTLTYRLEFKVYEDFLWGVLNQILADPNQLAISSMTITNSNTLLWPDYIKNVASTADARRSRGGAARRTERRRPAATNDLLSLLGGGTETAAEAPEQEEEKIAGLEERRQFPVGGDLLHVIVDLKVFRLKPEDEIETAAVTATGGA